MYRTSILSKGRDSRTNADSSRREREKVPPRPKGGWGARLFGSATRGLALSSFLRSFPNLPFHVLAREEEPADLLSSLAGFAMRGVRPCQVLFSSPRGSLGRDSPPPRCYYYYMESCFLPLALAGGGERLERRRKGHGRGGGEAPS